MQWRNRQREEQADAATARSEADEAERLRWSFTNTASLWNGDQIPTGAIYGGTPR